MGSHRVGHDCSDLAAAAAAAAAQPVNNVVIVSGEQQRDSVIHIHVFILPPIPLQSRLPHNIEQSSLLEWVLVGYPF